MATGPSSPTMATVLDWGFKILSVLVIPVFGWAWALNADIAVMQEKIQRMEAVIVEGQGKAETLARLEERIAILKEGLDDITRMLKNP